MVTFQDAIALARNVYKTPGALPEAIRDDTNTGVLMDEAERFLINAGEPVPKLPRRSS